MFSYSQWLNDLLSKAAGHKYIKRVPYQSGGRTRYRYIYNVTHTHGGKHVLDPDHMQVGTKLMLDATSGAEVHGHIQSVSGDKVTFVYDDGPKKGESVTMSKEKLASELDKVHGISSKLDAARKKQSDVVAKLKEKGASAKQIARAEARLKALGGDTPKGEESLQTRAQVAEGLRRAVARRVPPIEVKNGKIKKEPTQDHIETRMFFGAALRLSGVDAMALGNQLQTKESMRHVAEIYKTTHTKGTDFEEAKNAAFMPILEHVISELEGFDRDTWFEGDLEGREQLERRLDTLKKIKAGEREQ